MGKKIFAICPICGTCHGIVTGKKSLPGKKYIRIGKEEIKENYFEAMLAKYDENKPFGVEMEATGRASFKNWHYISPLEHPALFSSVRKVFYKAIESWLKKGWLDKAKLQNILQRVK